MPKPIVEYVNKEAFTTACMLASQLLVVFSFRVFYGMGLLGSGCVVCTGWDFVLKGLFFLRTRGFQFILDPVL